ncbi:hypothetical protein N665_0395s0032 [Sinapis alba]|nr:hypothetical protein N665_0395s0032 [Sinapis alba]
MDSRDPNLQNQELQPPPLGMLACHYPNSNTEAMMGPNSTSQPIHPRLTFGSLAPLQTTMDQKTLGYVDEVSSPPSLINQNEQQQVIKKKRGRPRKYAPPDGSTIALGLAPTSPLLDGDSGRVNTNSAKRARGRPPGSIKKQPFDALGTVFTPHVIEVNEGEEILSKVVAFSNQGPITVSVLSAAGAVSTVTLGYPSGIHNYKGRFEIVALSGLFSSYEVNGSITRTGSLTVALAGPNAQILGGLVCQLVAATPVQVTVGSFVEEAKKLKQSTSNNAQGQNPEPASAHAANMLNFGWNSQGPSSESSEENESGSPSMQQHDNNNNSGFFGNSMAQQQQLRQMQMYNLWPGSGQ